MAVVLFVNQYDLRVFANTDYNHNELLEYPGYGEAMYESIVEQTTFISGRYTENKDYVNQSINQVTDYAKGWWDEYMRISNMEPKEKIREMINSAGGYALTVGDFIKNLFNGFDEKENTGSTEPDYSGYEKYLRVDPNNPKNKVVALTGYAITLTFPPNNELGYSFTHEGINSVSYTLTGQNGGKGAHYGFHINGYSIRSVYASEAVVASVFQRASNSTTVGSIVSMIQLSGATMIITKNKVPVSIDTKPIIRNPGIKTINNYLKENPVQVVTPKPTAYLSCPDGTRINMKINGGTFLDVKGNIMSVDKNGTATIDSQICNLGWEKPKIQYIDGTDQVGISTPDNEIIDAETGETIVGGGDDEFDDEIKDGCGTLCALGKLLSGLGTIAKAIAGIPLKILDGLLELIKKVFLPSETFWSTNLDGLKDKFFHEELKEVQNGVESLESVGGGQFSDVNVSLLGVDNIKLIDSSPINMTLDTIHSWVRGFFYPLLLFFNINQMYRVIRGTSLIGIGGKKEE